MSCTALSWKKCFSKDDENYSCNAPDEECNKDEGEREIFKYTN